LAARQLTGRLSLARRFLSLVLGARRPGPFDDQDDAGEKFDSQDVHDGTSKPRT